jgi:hypothetical protein
MKTWLVIILLGATIAAVAADDIAIVGIVQVTHPALWKFGTHWYGRPMPKTSPKILTTAF